LRKAENDDIDTLNQGYSGAGTRGNGLPHLLHILL